MPTLPALPSRSLVAAVLATALVAPRSAAACPECPPTDNDHDGLVDWWEISNFGNITSQDQFGDPDGDGATNLDEYRDLTDPLTYDGPNAPTPAWPACGSEITGGGGVVTSNAVDPQHTSLLYDFEIFTDPGLTIELAHSQPLVPQGTGATTTWAIGVNLGDNTRYYWRVRARDQYTFGPWSTACSFFVNAFNEPPTIPVIDGPAYGAQVGTFTPTLRVRKSTDPDLDVLRYEFQVFADAALSARVAATANGGIAEGAGATTNWQANANPALQEDRYYYWRARAIDPDNLASGWSATGQFLVNTANTPPGPPTIVSPANGGVAGEHRPRLVLLNADDVDHDRPVYDWDLARDALFQQLVESGTGVAQDGGATTAFVPAADLDEDERYCWRVRADDRQATSGYARSCFLVSTRNDPPPAPVPLLPSPALDVGTTVPVFSWEPADDPEGDAVTYELEVHDDGGDLVDAQRAIAGNAALIAEVLVEGRSYAWRVRATDQGGLVGPFSPETPFRVALATPPDDGCCTADSGCAIASDARPDGLVLVLAAGVLAHARRRRRSRTRTLVAAAALLTTVLAGARSATASLADSDGDGLDDAWELAHFGNLTSQDQFGDPDADGMNNLAEYTAGTDPLVYDGPSAPTPASPACGSEIASLQTVLMVNNAVDPQGTRLLYEFALYSDPGLTIEVQHSVPLVLQATGAVTEWPVGVNLLENHHFYWRARAKDPYTFGPWSAPACSFFVNTVNEPPPAPRINSPAFGGQVDTTMPTLVVDNASDPDLDVLRYQFEVFSDAALSARVAQSGGGGVAEGGGGTTSWQVIGANPQLQENTFYYWRACAMDPDGLRTCSPTSQFFVDAVNDPPGPPAIVSPPNGSVVDDLRPRLVIVNSADDDRDDVVYDWDLAADEQFTSIVQGGVDAPGDAGATTTFATVELLEDHRYCWRIRADDGVATTTYSTSCFLVSARNDPPQAPVLLRPGGDGDVVTTTPLFTWEPAIDPEGDPVTYELELSDEHVQVIDVVPAIAGNVALLDHPLVDGASYSWRVRAKDRDGALGPFSTAIPFHVALGVGPDDGCCTAESGCRASRGDDAGALVLIGAGTAVLALRRRRARR